MDETKPEEHDLPPPTAPENIGVSFRGFSVAATAERFGHVLMLTPKQAGTEGCSLAPALPVCDQARRFTPAGFFLWRVGR